MSSILNNNILLGKFLMVQYIVSCFYLVTYFYYIGANLEVFPMERYFHLKFVYILYK